MYSCFTHLIPRLPLKFPLSHQQHDPHERLDYCACADVSNTFVDNVYLWHKILLIFLDMIRKLLHQLHLLRLWSDQSDSPAVVKDLLAGKGYGKSTAYYSIFLYFGDLCLKITAIKSCLIQYEFSKIPFALLMLGMIFLPFIH